MAAVTVLYADSPFPGVEVARVTTAADADTYAPRFLKRVEVGVFMPELNVANTDGGSITYDSDRTTCTIQVVGTTAVTGSLILFGKQ